MGKINEIIDEKAFAQLDKLLEDLGLAQTEFTKTAATVTALNTELSKSQGFKDLEVNIKIVEDATKKMQANAEKTTAAAAEAAKAEKELVQATKGKLLGIQEENALLNSLSGTIDQNVKQNIQLKTELKAVQAEQKKLSNEFVTSTAAAYKVTAQKAELSKREFELREAIRLSNLETRRQVKDIQAAEGSYNDLSNKLDRLRAVYRDLSEEERNNLEVGGALLASIQEYDGQLKSLDKSMGITNRQVGNYADNISAAVGQTGLFSKELAALKRAKDFYTASTKLATLTTQSFGKALIATGIGAIIAIIGTLIAFLTRTQKGMDLLAKATDAVSTFFGVFLDVLAETGGFIAEQLLPVLKGLGTILEGIAKLDFSKIKEGFIETRDAVNGIEGVGVLELAANFGKAAGRAVEAAREAARLRGELQAIEKEEARLEVTRAQQEATLQSLRELSADETKSARERAEASARVLEIENVKAEKSIELLQRKLAVTRAQNALTESTEADLQKERDIEIEIANLEAQSAARKFRFIKQEQQLRKQAADEARALREKQEAEALKAAKSLLDLEASRIKRALERNKEVVDDEKLAFEDRISNLGQYIENQAKLIENAYQKELLNKDLLETDLMRLEEERNAKIEALRQEEADIRLNILTEGLAKEDAERAKAAARALAQIETQRDAELTALTEAFNRGEINEVGYANRRLQIQKDFTRDLVNQEIAAVEALIEVNKARGLDTFDEEKKLAALRLKLASDTAAAEIEELKKVRDFEAQVVEARKQLISELGNLAITLVDARFEKELQALERQSEEIEANKQRQLEAVNESIASEDEKALQIATIEAKAAKQKEALEARQRQLQERRARFEKAANIANILGATAVAIVKQLAVTPLPFGAPLVATIGAIGAAQLAAAAATPIPQFYTGTDNAPEGLAWVGEKGNELRINPDGKASLTPGKPTLTYLEKGTKIIPAEETRQMLAGAGLGSIVNYNSEGGFDSERLAKSYESGVKQLKKAILSKKEKSVVITKDGIHYLYKSGNNWKNYLGRNL